MKPYSPLNKVFLTVDKRFDDEIKTESGIKLYKDTTYEPEWHVTTIGTVATLPLTFKADFMNEGIEPEVKEGDKVVFHYFGVTYDENRVTVDSQDYYMLDYYKIFAALRETIVPLHGYCLIKVDNEFTGEKTKGGIIIPEALRKKKVDTYGELMHAHKSLRMGAKVGDTVFFQKEFAYEQNIEGQDYYIINQSELQAYKKQ